jgi:hypothetical protein
VNAFNYLGSLISYENEMDIDNKLNKYLKITGIINNVFKPKKTLMKTRKNYTIHQLFQLCYMAVKIGPLKQEMQEE